MLWCSDPFSSLEIKDSNDTKEHVKDLRYLCRKVQSCAKISLWSWEEGG